MADLYYATVDLIWGEIALMLGRLSLLIIALLIVGLIVAPAIDRLARRHRHTMRLHDRHPYVNRPYDRKDPHP